MRERKRIITETETNVQNIHIRRQAARFDGRQGAGWAVERGGEESGHREQNGDRKKLT